MTDKRKPIVKLLILLIGVFMPLALFGNTTFDDTIYAFKLRQEVIANFPEMGPVLKGEMPLTSKTGPTVLLSQIQAASQADSANIFGNPYYSFLEALIYHKTGQSDLADAAFEKTQYQAQDHLGIHWNIILVCERMARSDNQGAWFNRQLDHIRDIVFNHGVEGDETLFDLAIQRGDLFRKNDRRDLAQTYYDFAKDMNPLSPIPYFRLASLTGFSDPGNAISNFLDGFTVVKKNFRFQLTFLYHVYRYLLLALAIGLTAIVFVSVLKHLPKIHHVVYTSLPSKSVPSIRSAVAWIMVFSPVLTNVGITGYALIGLVFTWRYYSKVERIATGLFLVYLFLLPTLLGYNFLLMKASAEDSLNQSIWRLQHFTMDDAAHHRLSETYAADPDDGVVNFTFGLLHKRQAALLIGELDESGLTPTQSRYRSEMRHQGLQKMEQSRSFYSRALSESSGFSGIINNNVGNTYFIEKKLSPAGKYYREATRGPNPLPVAYLNLSQIYNQMKNLVEVENQQEKAMALDPDIKSKFERIGNHPNRVALDQFLPDEVLWQQVVALPIPQSGQLEALWFGKIKGIMLEQMPLVAIGSFVLMVLLSLIKGGSGNLRECTVCHAVISPATWRKMKNNLLCHSCYRAVAGTKLDAMRFAILARISKTAEKRFYIIAMVLGIIFPGAGHIYRNFYVWGYILITIFALVLPGVLFSNHLYKMDPTLADSFSSALLLILAGIIMLSCYLMSVLSLYLEGARAKTAKDLEQEIVGAASEKETEE